MDILQLRETLFIKEAERREERANILEVPGGKIKKRSRKEDDERKGRSVEKRKRRRIFFGVELDSLFC